MEFFAENVGLTLRFISGAGILVAVLWLFVLKSRTAWVQEFVMVAAGLCLGLYGAFLHEHILYVIGSKEFIGSNTYEQILLRQALLSLGLILLQLLIGGWFTIQLIKIVRSLPARHKAGSKQTTS